MSWPDGPKGVRAGSRKVGDRSGTGLVCLDPFGTCTPVSLTHHLEPHAILGMAGLRSPSHP